MARAKTTTWLPLDRWAEIIGLHPFHFNGLSSKTYLTNLTCGMVWFQHPWQDADRLSREDVAVAIRDAERKIAEHAGYYLIPDWIESERIYFDRPAMRELYNSYGRNVRGQWQSLVAGLGHIVSGGVRAKDGIETAAVVRSDEDGDGYSETVTLAVGTSVTDPDEIRVYYPGESGADEWEIKPINVSIENSVATITFKSWQIVDPDLQEKLNAVAVDAETDGNYLTTVDVYRVYNDPQAQVTFVWEQDTGFDCSCGGTCLACQLGTQAGCFHLRDARIGILVPAPAEWSTADQAFTAQYFSTCRGPDQALVSYYSGNRDKNNSNKQPKTQMEDYWATAVAYYAASLLDKGGCDCDNVSHFIENLRAERSFSSREKGSYFQTQSQLTNPLGGTNGAKYAYERITAPGRRVMKQ